MDQFSVWTFFFHKTCALKVAFKVLHQLARPRWDVGIRILAPVAQLLKLALHVGALATGPAAREKVGPQHLTYLLATAVPHEDGSRGFGQGLTADRYAACHRWHALVDVLL